jgi:hypothetical protein
MEKRSRWLSEQLMDSGTPSCDFAVQAPADRMAARVHAFHTVALSTLPIGDVDETTYHRQQAFPTRLCRVELPGNCKCEFAQLRYYWGFCEYQCVRYSERYPIGDH